jgi:hypothetical protein
MPREAKLFLSSSGSVARGVLAVPGEHSAPMDKKCSEDTQADRAGSSPRLALSLGTTERSLRVASKSPRGYFRLGQAPVLIEVAQKHQTYFVKNCFTNMTVA